MISGSGHDVEIRNTPLNTAGAQGKSIFNSAGTITSG